MPAEFIIVFLGSLLLIGVFAIVKYHEEHYDPEEELLKMKLKEEEYKKNITDKQKEWLKIHYPSTYGNLFGG